MSKPKENPNRRYACTSLTYWAADPDLMTVAQHCALSVLRDHGWKELYFEMRSRPHRPIFSCLIVERHHKRARILQNGTLMESIDGGI